MSLRVTGSCVPNNLGRLPFKSQYGDYWSQLLGPGVAIKFKNSKIQDSAFYAMIFQGETGKGD